MYEQLLQYFFKKSPVAFSYHKVILDDYGFPYDCEFLDASNTCEKVLGLNVSQVSGKRFNELFSSAGEDTNMWKEAYQDAVINNKTIVVDIYNQLVSKWIRVTIFTLDTGYFACIFVDVTKEYMQEKEIEGFLKVNIDMLCVVNTDLDFLKVNEEFEKVLGYKVSEFQGKNFLSLVHQDYINSTLDAIEALEEEKPISSFINKYRCKDGSYKYLEWYIQLNGKYIYAFARDVSELKETKTDTDNLIVMDQLTGLLNRRFFDKRVAEEMERSDRYDESLSMLIFDLNNFKSLSDTLGHAVEEVLKQTAEIVSSVIRKYDILVRADDGKFILLMPKTAINGAVVVAEKIRKALDNTSYPNTETIMASFGVAERMKSESFKNWYKRMEKALHRAKKEDEDSIIIADNQQNLDINPVQLQWRHQWESGDKNIDEQHKNLLDLANNLVSMYLSNMDLERIMEQLDILLENIIEHFNYEEKFFIDIGCQDCSKYSKINKNLIGKTFQLKEAYQNGELNSSAFFSFIVDDVVIGHMLNENMRNSSYTEEKDIS